MFSRFCRTFVVAVCVPEHAVVLIPDQWVCVLGCVCGSQPTGARASFSTFIVEENKASAGVLRSFLENQGSL